MQLSAKKHHKKAARAARLAALNFCNGHSTYAAGQENESPTPYSSGYDIKVFFGGEGAFQMGQGPDQGGFLY